jgi:hypothetical protein
LAGDDVGERIGNGFGYGRVVQVEPVSEAGHLAGDLIRGHGGDQGRGRAQRGPIHHALLTSRSQWDGDLC